MLNNFSQKYSPQNHDKLSSIKIILKFHFLFKNKTSLDDVGL